MRASIEAGSSVADASLTDANSGGQSVHRHESFTQVNNHIAHWKLFAGIRHADLWYTR